jgi:hypothetical protein
MSELSKERLNYGLTGSKKEEIDYNLDLLLGKAEDLGISENDASIQRVASRDRMVNEIINPATGIIVAQHIIDRHRADSEPSAYSLYAYWSIIQHAADLSPTSAIPADFIKFTRELALVQKEQSNEDNILANLLILSELGSEVSAELEDKEYSGELINITDLAGLRKEKLQKLCVISDRDLKEYQIYTKQLLSLCDKTTHFADQHLLETFNIEPDHMLSIITGRRFTTTEGYNAACAQHDINRLVYRRSTKITDLFRDITSERFRTTQGSAAAMYRHDMNLLELDPNEYLNMQLFIEDERFFTNEGTAAAKAQHDKVRLLVSSNKFTDLVFAIQSDKFYTDEGKVSAAQKHDDIRIRMIANDIPQLKNELISGNFLSEQGKEEAKRLIQESQV